MIGDGDVLRGALGRLVASDPDVNRTLREIFLAAGTGDGRSASALPPLVARDGGRHVAHVLPLSRAHAAPAWLCGRGRPVRAEGRWPRTPPPR